MSTEEDTKKRDVEGPSTDDEPQAAPTSDRPAGESATGAGSDSVSEYLAEKRAEGEDAVASGESDHGAVAPTQLGTTRFVYAAYFAGAIGVAFVSSKALGYAWQRLASWRPATFGGEAKDEYIMPVAALIGAGVALYYWKRTRARVLAEEVAKELSKVTWPTKEEVTNSTTVVIVTTAAATIFFAVMDWIWQRLTNVIYSF